MAGQSTLAAPACGVRALRWCFYLSVAEVLAFFTVPALVFPVRYVMSIEIISALTLGLPLAVFFGSVSVCGLFLDRNRRLLYAASLSVAALWLIWAAVSWSYIDRMAYLLR